ncbi:MAG: hypothetical protein R3279_06415 [Putridiphycobacter sp.]|nr:hypothetical protein [Putridiphycobacter sp.]
MQILHFLFLLGVCFTIFEFIWAIFKFIFNFITSGIQNPVKTNSVRIVKYILFTAVTVQFVQLINQNSVLINKQAVGIALGAIMILFYLIGKYQTRAMFTQFNGIANQFTRGIFPAFDGKLEITLIIGSVAFFVLGSIFPAYTSNGITTWFTDSILNIYDTPFFGFVFKVIGGFVLVNTLLRAGRTIGGLLSGKSFAEATKRDNPFGGRFNGQMFNQNPFQNNTSQNSISEEPEFTDYEEVTDDEEPEK